jgi:hypothetical protein
MKPRQPRTSTLVQGRNGRSGTASANSVGPSVQPRVVSSRNLSTVNGQHPVVENDIHGQFYR